MPDVLMLTYDDWANSSYNYAKALRTLGLDVVFFKGAVHIFNYPEQGAIHYHIGRRRMNGNVPLTLDVPELGLLAKMSKVIHYTDSTFINTGLDLSKKLVVMNHGGTMYRLSPEIHNKAFNRFVDATLIQCPDLLGLGAKNEHLVYYGVDTDYIQPSFERLNPNKVLIGHFPSNPASKGTAAVLKVIEKLEEDSKLVKRFEYAGCGNVEHGNRLLSWLENLERMKQADVIVETCKPEQYGRKFGEWGNTALEAAALGKIVVTNTRTADLYEREYGKCALEIANNVTELELVLRKILDMTDAEILDKKETTRFWVESSHNLQATGQRLWNEIYSGFF